MSALLSKIKTLPAELQATSRAAVLARACQINSQMIACPPDTIDECKKSHIGATAFTPTLSAEPFGSIFDSR